MQKVIEFFTTNRMKAFYWTAANGFIVVIALGLADVDWVYAPIIIALLNGFSKWVNVEVLPQYKK